MMVEYHEATGGQADPSLARWLAGLPQGVRERLVAIGLLDPHRAAASKPLAEHMGDFGRSLAAKGNSSMHVEVLMARVRKIGDGCGFRYHSEIGGSKVLSFLNGLRADTEGRRGISAQTFNFYLSAVKQFCRWMVKDRRAADSPVAHLDGLNVKTDRRRDRRPLSVDELRRLLEAAYHGRDRRGMTGPERALLYQAAAETGLRAGELRSLTRASFDLGGDPPTVTVEAAHSKHRRQDVLPLRAELAEFLGAKTPAAPCSGCRGGSRWRMHSRRTWRRPASPTATVPDWWPTSTPCDTRSSPTWRPAASTRRRRRRWPDTRRSR